MHRPSEPLSPPAPTNSTGAPLERPGCAVLGDPDANVRPLSGRGRPTMPLSGPGRPTISVEGGCERLNLPRGGRPPVGRLIASGLAVWVQSMGRREGLRSAAR